ncbi:YraN family protein [Nocardia tengchongensis]|uniref:YraN family protein n=1 Tax=Nocardia tengchongensis TaxID=2055889 RepID=UPI0036A47937
MAQYLALGAQGENLAADYLRTAGLDIIARNWRCRFGELDVIAREGDITAFIEVKTRRNLTCGRPEEAVTFLKQQRIRALARHWLHEHPGPFQRVRFDVVSIILRPGRPPEILHLKAAF